MGDTAKTAPTATDTAKPDATLSGELSQVVGEVENLDVPRESLLDVVMKRAEELGLVEKIQRVVIVGRYAKATDTGATAKDLIDGCVNKTVANDEDGGEITGVTLLLPGCCISLLEGPQRLIIGALRVLDSATQSSQEILNSVRLLSSVQDAPGRSFPIYGSRILQLPKGDPAVPDKDGILNLIPDISINLQKFGRELSTLGSKEEIEGKMDSVQRQHGEYLPRVEDVSGLCVAEDVLTLEEFFDLYYSPTKCLGGPLDAEVVWPLPPSLIY